LEAQVKRKKTITLAGVGVAGVALALSGVAASAGQGDAATGGGQIAVGDRGAGDTIAFTAQAVGDTARGQVQYVDRADGTGQGQTVVHGTVTCIQADGNTARIAGEWRDGGTFGLTVVDNGEGSNASGEDMITLTPDLTDCSEDREDGEPMGLARGNAQVRDRG
jgi:hypothetical protein